MGLCAVVPVNIYRLQDWLWKIVQDHRGEYLPLLGYYARIQGGPAAQEHRGTYDRFVISRLMIILIGCCQDPCL